MTRKRPPRPRRMSSILDGLGSRDSFATTEAWQEYQDLLARLKMQSFEHTRDGEEIPPAQGFTYRQPSKRKKNIAAREVR